MGNRIKFALIEKEIRSIVMDKRCFTDIDFTAVIRLILSKITEIL